MQLDVLRKVGLSEGEIKVYDAILCSGSSPVNRIHEAVGIERRNIYDILNKLIEKGLVSYIIENKTRFFRITNPDKIIGYLEEKKHELDTTKSEIEKKIPEIMSVFTSSKPEIGSEIFRGIEGIKAVWADMLDSRAVHWIGSGRYIPKNYSAFFVQYNRERIRRRVFWYNLMRHELRKEVKSPYEYEEIKYLPQEFSGNPVVIFIFRNKVATMLAGSNLFAFVIESRDLADNYLRYHKYIWDNVAKR